jgi:hypothetical protein
LGGAAAERERRAILGIIALAIFGPWAYWIDRHREPAG